MKNIVKTVTLLSLLSLAACNSTGDTENSLPVATDIENAQDTAQVNETERQALATTVFYFGFDSDELSAQDRDTLVYHANRLKNDTNISIRLEGHASEEGTREYNLALGERRGNSIAMFLMVNGVAGSQIEVVSYGEEQPAVVGSTEEDRAKNRRVEIK